MGAIRSIKGNEKGMILVVTLTLLAVISLVGATAVVITSTDIKIGGNYDANLQAFYDADAGVNYAIAKIEDGLKASPATFSLPTSTDPNDSNHTTSFTYPTPSGFSFSISGITKTGTNTYSFTSTGSGPNNARTTLKATLEAESVIKHAAFGDKKLEVKNSGDTKSYDSDSPDPTKNDPDDPSFVSTHEADVSSNDWLVTKNGANIDGSGVLGEKEDGSATTNDIHSGTNFYGPTPVNAGRIDPDPLGVTSGGAYDPSTYSASNDNASAPLISGDTISLNTSGTLYGKAGGANYYVTDVELKSGAILNIDTTLGPVNIFLTGPFEAKNGSNITLIPDGKDPSTFSIFSNSTDTIEFKHGSDFAGLVYAPYADVIVKNSADIYGAIWGKTVELKNSGTVYFDSKLKSKHTSNNLSLSTWKEDNLS